MAEKSRLEGKREKLAYYLPFDASETPKWRKKEELPISEMITEIMDYHKQWEEAKSANLYSESLLERVRNQFLVKFIFHVNMEEEKGFGTFEETDEFLNSLFSGGNLQLPFSHNQQETLNLRKAYEHLLTKVRREERENDYGLIESTLLKETHGILMHGKPTHSEFSNEKRYNDYTEERYYYQQPVDMEKAVDKLLDKYNVMFELCTKDGLKEFDDFYYLFKTCAWLLFELLDLHPFRDGNGRLCRILCSYLLSKFTPFPTPVYNVWTDSSKTDYYEALVDAREQDLPKLCRHPTALTTMIIECSYYGWGKFFEALDGNKSS